jgi:hypothetical protein
VDNQDTKCKDHPDAPHGFNRNASLTEDRYVCDCEYWEPPVAAVNMSQECVDETVEREHEPVVWVTDNGFYELEPKGIDAVPLYTAPPKRDWVGLTDGDMEALFLNEDGVRFARYIEAKLKEKNS